MPVSFSNEFMPLLAPRATNWRARRPANRPTHTVARAGATLCKTNNWSAADFDCFLREKNSRVESSCPPRPLDWRIISGGDAVPSWPCSLPPPCVARCRSWPSARPARDGGNDALTGPAAATAAVFHFLASLRQLRRAGAHNGLRPLCCRRSRGGGQTVRRSAAAAAKQFAGVSPFAFRVRVLATAAALARYRSARRQQRTVCKWRTFA